MKFSGKATAGQQTTTYCTPKTVRERHKRLRTGSSAQLQSYTPRKEENTSVSLNSPSRLLSCVPANAGQGVGLQGCPTADGIS